MFRVSDIECYRAGVLAQKATACLRLSAIERLRVGVFYVYHSRHTIALFNMTLSGLHKNTPPPPKKKEKKMSCNISIEMIKIDEN